MSWKLGSCVFLLLFTFSLRASVPAPTENMAHVIWIATPDVRIRHSQEVTDLFIIPKNIKTSHSMLAIDSDRIEYESLDQNSDLSKVHGDAKSISLKEAITRSLKKIADKPNPKLVLTISTHGDKGKFVRGVNERAQYTEVSYENLARVLSHEIRTVSQEFGIPAGSIETVVFMSACGAGSICSGFANIYKEGQFEGLDVKILPATIDPPSSLHNVRDEDKMTHKTSLDHGFGRGEIFPRIDLAQAAILVESVLEGREDKLDPHFFEKLASYYDFVSQLQSWSSRNDNHKSKPLTVKQVIALSVAWSKKFAIKHAEQEKFFYEYFAEQMRKIPGFAEDLKKLAQSKEPEMVRREADFLRLVIDYPKPDFSDHTKLIAAADIAMQPGRFRSRWAAELLRKASPDELQRTLLESDRRTFASDQYLESGRTSMQGPQHVLLFNAKRSPELSAHWLSEFCCNTEAEHAVMDHIINVLLWGDRPENYKGVLRQDAVSLKDAFQKLRYFSSNRADFNSATVENAVVLMIPEMIRDTKEDTKVRQRLLLDAQSKEMIFAPIQPQINALVAELSFDGDRSLMIKALNHTDPLYKTRALNLLAGQSLEDETRERISGRLDDPDPTVFAACRYAMTEKRNGFTEGELKKIEALLDIPPDHYDSLNAYEIPDYRVLRALSVLSEVHIKNDNLAAKLAKLQRNHPNPAVRRATVGAARMVRRTKSAEEPRSYTPLFHYFLPNGPPKVEEKDPC